jgi:hypothetical protein
MTPFWVQGVLLFLYLVLGIGFTFKRGTWPLAVYYAGCFVKDAAVMALAFWRK